MKGKISVFILVAVLTVSATFISFADQTGPSAPKETVTITDAGNYYEVSLDLRNGVSHREIGEEYASKILQAVPDYEALFDSYVAEALGSDDFYKVVLKRVEDIKPQINKDYRDEIDGMGSKFSGGDQDVRGDGKLSLDELYAINLFPDTARGTQCSALGVYGGRSETRHTLAERVLDWYSGSQNQLAKIQAVATFKNGKKSICSIGYLGFMGVISGLNDNRVFGAILDSGTGAGYTSESKYSYPLDLRYALENSRTLDGVANFLKSPERGYTFGHLIFLCDPSTSKVLENNISSGTDSIRDVRTEKSVLNDGIQWGIDNSVACVNSFLLKGNFDNHTSALFNTARWDSLKRELTSKGDKVTLEELREIASFHTGTNPGLQAQGDLYNTRTQQIIIFEPDKMNLQISFRPKDGNLPGVPSFKKVRVKFW